MNATWQQPLKVGSWWILPDDFDYVSRTRDLDLQKEVNAVLLQLRPGNGDWAVDVGAYIGDTPLVLTQRGWRVLAIEAMPDAFECLQRNCPTALCVCEAAGDGSARWVPDENPGYNAGYGQGRCLRATDSGRRTVALDEFGLPNCGLLKVDVEGFEPLVFRGAAGLLKKFRPLVLTEVNLMALARHKWNPDDVLGTLRGMGYACRKVAQPNDNSSDWLCWPNE